jgi:hypothetical protein
MKQLFAVLALSCVGCAYHAPTEPTNIARPPSPTEPATMSLGALPGAGTSTIVVVVQNAGGGRIPDVSVAFSTDGGSLSVSRVNTNQDGEARAVLTASSAATVTVTAGTLTRSTIVAIQPAPPNYPPAPPPVLTPPPPPPPPPAPSFSVGVGATPSTLVAGGSATLVATVQQQNGAPAPTAYAWDCSGTGAPIVVTATNSTVCAYATPGTITSRVNVSGGAVFGPGAVTVTVLAPLTVAIVPTSFTPSVGVFYNFTATVTSTGTVPSSLQWEWDTNGDGTFDDTIASAPNPNQESIAFGSIGVKTVKVRVTDTTTGRVALGTVQVTAS